MTEPTLASLSADVAALSEKLDAVAVLLLALAEQEAPEFPQPRVHQGFRNFQAARKGNTNG